MAAAVTSAIKPLRQLMREEEPEWLVWALVVVMLAIGGLAGTVVERRTVAIKAGDLTLKHPAGWVKMRAEGPFEVLRVGEAFETAVFPAQVSVHQMPVTEVSTTAQTLGDLALKWSNRQTQELLGYKVLNIEPAHVGGQETIRVEYIYVAEPPMGGPNSIPVVARGADYLIRQGEKLTVISFVAANDAFEEQAATRERILASLELLNFVN
ncbi:MAG: hypothetical protein ACUVR4_02720 [Anaerolineae bacterium]